MNTQHTPGPWSIEYNQDNKLKLGGNGDLYTSISSESGFGSIAHVLYKKVRIMGDSIRLAEQTFEANARLIAAAPELLEALNNLLDKYTELVNCGDCGNWNPEEESEVIAARNAIAKATNQKEETV